LFQIFKKKNGKLIILIDNGDYWRHHVYLGNYHANIFEDETDEILTHHKMMFQMKHISKMLKIAGLKVIKEKYYRDYKFPRGHIDYLMPKHLGCNMMRIEAIKEKVK